MMVFRLFDAKYQITVFEGMSFQFLYLTLPFLPSFIPVQVFSALQNFSIAASHLVLPNIVNFKCVAAKRKAFLNITLYIEMILWSKMKEREERERERERGLICHHTWEEVLEGEKGLDREFACMFLIICFRLYLYLCMCEFLLDTSTVILQGRSHTPILSL